jgi:hypothetical protein
MPGLDPGIHQSSKAVFESKMDCRVKPGNDSLRPAAIPFVISS